MKNKSVLLIIIILVILLAPNCSKDDLVLDQDYVTVSDLTRYCRCKCRETFPCENKKVKIKGHIDYYSFKTDFSYQSYSLEKIRIQDIRNGYFIEIYFSSNDTAIINKILSSNETDMCYIKGIVKSWQMNTMFDCTLEAEILLHSADDIYFENKY